MAALSHLLVLCRRHLAALDARQIAFSCDMSLVSTLLRSDIESLSATNAK